MLVKDPCYNGQLNTNNFPGGLDDVEDNPDW